MKKYLHVGDTKYYIENICHQFPNSHISSNSDEYTVQKQPPKLFFKKMSLKMSQYNTV